MSAPLSPTTAMTVSTYQPTGTLPALQAQTQTHTLAAEVPVALVFNGIAHAVLMASPGDAALLALGFALTEGIIDRVDDCYDIDVRTAAAGTQGLPTGIAALEVRLDIASRCMARLQDKRRSMSGRTGCGVCGVESFAALDLDCPPVPSAAWLAQVDAPTVLRAMQALGASQPLHRCTRTTHAAAWANLDGQLLHVMEDVGRHNALDKLIGHLARTAQLGTPGFVLLSSRGSHELVRKCARVGIAALATPLGPNGHGGAHGAAHAIAPMGAMPHTGGGAVRQRRQRWWRR